VSPVEAPVSAESLLLLARFAAPGLPSAIGRAAIDAEAGESPAVLLRRQRIDVLPAPALPVAERELAQTPLAPALIAPPRQPVLARPMAIDTLA